MEAQAQRLEDMLRDVTDRQLDAGRRDAAARPDARRLQRLEERVARSSTVQCGTVWFLISSCLAPDWFRFGPGLAPAWLLL
jgi:hypothetical protein